MGTKKQYHFVLLIYGVFIFVLSISPALLADTAEECQIVARAFELTGAKPAKLEVTGWVTVKGLDIGQEQAAVHLTQRIGRLAKFGFTPVVKTEYDGQGRVLVAEGDVNSDIHIKIVMKNDFRKNEKGQKAAYLAAMAATQNTSRSLADLNRYLSAIFPEKDMHRSTMLAGSFPGRMSPPEVNEIVRRLASEMGTQNVETLANGQLVSITGYIPSVRTRLTLGEKSVNINIALRYNSIENKTYFYAGSPIITNGY